MKKYILSTLVIVTTVILSLNDFNIPLVSGESREDKPITLADIESLENSIIIEGIDMTSSKAPAGDADGEIIFDDTFDDKGLQEIDNETIIHDRNNRTINTSAKKKAGSASNTKRKKQKKVNRQQENEASLTIEDLKKKDSKWHLSEHIIQKGENIWEIAEEYETNYRYIIRINNVDEPKRLLPGKKLKIPNRQGVTYKIQEGDTLYRIAERYNVERERIVSHNNIRKDKIYYGNDIFLPGATVPVNDNYINDAVNEPREKINRTASLKRPVKKKSNNNIMAFSWPVKGRITSSFGKRVDPFTKMKKFHCGIDISCNEGTPIKASFDGKVIFSGWKDGYGKVVVLKHEKGYITVYAHNSENLVDTGDDVSRGKVIAYSGMTGAVTGAHLHYEIRKYLAPLDPMKMLK